MCLIINFILHAWQANKQSSGGGSVQMKLCKSLMKLLVQRQTTARNMHTQGGPCAANGFAAPAQADTRAAPECANFALLCCAKCFVSAISARAPTPTFKVAELWVLFPLLLATPTCLNFEFWARNCDPSVENELKSLLCHCCKPTQSKFSLPFAA